MAAQRKVNARQKIRKSDLHCGRVGKRIGYRDGCSEKKLSSGSAALIAFPGEVDKGHSDRVNEPRARTAVQHSVAIRGDADMLLPSPGLTPRRPAGPRTSSPNSSMRPTSSSTRPSTTRRRRSAVSGSSVPPRARTDFERYWRPLAAIGRLLCGNFHA
jgi:hypothetical protein